jgi:hypothetical protein
LAESAYKPLIFTVGAEPHGHLYDPAALDDGPVSGMFHERLYFGDETLKIIMLVSFHNPAVALLILSILSSTPHLQSSSASALS